MTDQRRRPRVAGLLLAAGAGRRYGGPKALADSGSGPWVQRSIETLAECAPLFVVVGASSAEVASLVPAGVQVVQNPSFRQGMGSSLRAGLVALAEWPGSAVPDGVVHHQTGSDRRADPGPAVGDAVAAGRAGAAGRQVGAAGRQVGASVGSGAGIAGGSGADAVVAGPVGTAKEPIDAALVMLVDLPGVVPAVVARLLAVAGSVVGVRSMLARAAFAGVPGHPVLLGREHWAGVIELAVGDRGARDYLASHRVTLIECGDLGTGEDIDVSS